MAPKGQMPMAWPLDSDGEPMAVITASASELVPTVQYGNVNIGPVSVMIPIKNDEATHLEMGQYAQRLCQYLIGTERRLIQWALDPSLKPQTPTEVKQEVAEEAAKPPQS